MTGPRLELWRAPTDNDGGNHLGSYDVSDPMEGRGLGIPGPSYAAQWREAGLDRLTSRVVRLTRRSNSLERATRWAAADTLKSELVRAGVDYLRLHTERPFVPALRYFLSSRGGLTRGRG